jgi:hypothetical protein
MKDIARHALRMHPHEDARAFVNDSENERDMLVIVDIVAVADYPPNAIFGREPCFSDAVNQTLRLEAMGNELRDRDERQPVFGGEALQLGTACARTVAAQDFAQDAGGREPGKPRQVYRRLSVSNTLQDPALARPDGRDVSGAP